VKTKDYQKELRKLQVELVAQAVGIFRAAGLQAD